MCATQNRNEVVLESLECLFSYIALMIVGRDKLEVNAFLTKVSLETGRGFIAQMLVERVKAMIDKVLVDTI